MARSGGRSSALARAQAQLSGRRVPVKPKDPADELQEYMHALNKKTSALKLSQPSVADLSDLSEQESEKYRAAAGPQQESGTQSRFLKKKTPPGNDGKSHAVITIEARTPVHPRPVQSKVPASAALRKLAEIENRHRLRKLEIDISENDSDLRTSEERPFSNRSSSEFSTGEKRFVKKKVNIMEPARHRNERAVRNKSAKSKAGAAESEDEEMLHLVGSSVELSENDERWWKRPKPPRTPSPPSKSTPRRKLRHSPLALGFVSPRRPPSRLPSRTPSPPSYGSPRFPRRTPSFTRFRSRSPSPSVRSSLTSPAPRTRLGRQSRTPVSQRSDAKSLDELFSRAEDLSSASSNDFKLNILSLDELALPGDAEEAKGKMIPEKPKDIKHLPAPQDKGQSRSGEAKSFRRPSISEEESVVDAHTETNRDSEIVTHRHEERSSSSEEGEASDQSTINSAYSEDFEESARTDTAHRSKSDSYSYSKSTSAQKSVLSSDRSYNPSSKARRRDKMAGNVQRITVKEIAVQTNEAGSIYHWPQASIGIEHRAAPFTDPVSMVGHIVSPDLIEALTTYNPMALALNDLLKQQLSLTRSFVGMAQQLYLSAVTSLENKSYRYTTLENTEEYMQQQRAHKWKQRPREELSGSHSIHGDRDR